MVGDLTTSEDRKQAQPSEASGKTPEELRKHALDALKPVAALLDRKAGADATGYKRWLSSLAEHGALASKEGGFLGIGGIRVSEQETAALRDISTTLRSSSISGWTSSLVNAGEKESSRIVVEGAVEARADTPASVCRRHLGPDRAPSTVPEMAAHGAPYGVGDPAYAGRPAAHTFSLGRRARLWYARRLPGDR